MEVAEEKPPLQELYDEYNPKLNLAKTYDEFAATMKKESSRKDFFDTFNKDLNLAKDFNEFEGVLGLKKKDLPQSEPTPKEPKTPSLGYGSEQEAITGGAQKDFTSASPLVSNVKSEKTPKIIDADPLKIREASVKTQADTSPQDYIPPKVAKIPTVSPKMVTEKNYQITVQKYQQADKQAKDLGSQLEQAHPEILKIKSDMDAEFQDASQQTAKSLHDQFQQKVQNKELSIEDANVQLQGEIKKSHDAIAKGIQDKYAPQFAKFNELYNAAIEADSEAKLQYDRATAFEKAQGIIDRNNQAETDSRQNYGNLEGATESGLYLLNKGFYGAVPLVFRAVDAMKYVGEGVDVNRAFDFANIDANASPIMSGLEKLSNQYSELHKEKAAQVERRTGTMDEALAKNDYVKFAELSGLSLVEFAPTMLGQSALALVTGGTSSALNVLANTAVFGAQSYYGDVKDRTDMSEKQKFSNAVTNGAIFAMASETMGRLAIPFKNLITTVGREEAEKTIATTLSGSLKGGLKNLTPFFKASSGAFEVGSLGYVQTWGNALTDPQYKDWTPQQINNEAMKSFVKMAGMGAAGSLLGTGIPEMIKSDIFTGKNKKAATDVSSKIDEIDKTLPTLDETMQQMLAQKKMDLTSSLNDIIIKDAKETEHLSAPQRQKLIELNETGNNIKELLSNTDTPIEGEPKKVLEDNLKDIEKAKTELITESLKQQENATTKSKIEQQKSNQPTGVEEHIGVGASRNEKTPNETDRGDSGENGTGKEVKQEPQGTREGKVTEETAIPQEVKTTENGKIREVQEGQGETKNEGKLQEGQKNGQKTVQEKVTEKAGVEKAPAISESDIKNLEKKGKGTTPEGTQLAGGSPQDAIIEAVRKAAHGIYDGVMSIEEAIQKGIEKLHKSGTITDEEKAQLEDHFKVEGEKKPSEPTAISKARIKERYGKVFEHESVSVQQKASEAQSLLEERAATNGVSPELEAQNHVNELQNAEKGIDFKSSAYDIITTTFHLNNLERQLSELRNDGYNDAADLKQIEIDKVNDLILQKLGRTSGENLNLFGAVFKRAADGKLEATRQDFAKLLNVEKMPMSEAELEEMVKEGMPKSEAERLRPYVKVIADLKKSIEETKLASEKINNEFDKKGVEQYIKDEVARRLKKQGEKPSNKTLSDKDFETIGGFITIGKEKGTPLRESKNQKTISKTIDDVAEKFLRTYKNEKFKDFIEVIEKKTGTKISDADKGFIKERFEAKEAELESQNPLTKIKDIVKESGETTITKGMVENGLIKGVIDNHIIKGESADEVIKKSLSDLKEILPDITTSQLTDAILRKGEFKLETKKTVENKAKETGIDVKRIANKIAKEKTLSAADDIHAIQNDDSLSAKEKKEKIEARKTEFEKELDTSIKNHIQGKANAENLKKELQKAVEKAKEIRLKAEQDAKKAAESAAESLKLVEAQNRVKDAQKVEDRNKKELQKAVEKIADLESKIKYVKEQKKVFETSIRDKKGTAKELAKLREDLKQAMLDAGLRVQTTDKADIRTAKEFENKIDEVKNSDLDKTEKDKQISEIKTERDKVIGKTKQGVLANLKSNVDGLLGDINSQHEKAIIDGDEGKIKELSDFKKDLEKLSEKTKATFENAKDKIDQTDQLLQELINKYKGTDFEPELQDISDNNRANWDKTAKELQQQRLMDASVRKEKEAKRKLTAEQFTEIPTAQHDVLRDHALMVQNLKTTKALQQVQAMKRKASDANKTWVDTALMIRAKYLIASFSAVMKVGVSGITKPIMDTMIKQSFGRISAMLTGVKPTELRNVGKGFASLIKTTEGAKKLLTTVNKNYVDALKNFESIKENFPENSRQFQRAQTKMLQAEIDKEAAFPYLFINSNSGLDIKEIMLHGATDFDEQVGSYNKSYAKDRDKLEEVGFWLDAINRTHGAIKSVSARQAMFDGYIENLQYFQKKDGQITPESRQVAFDLASIGNNAEYKSGKFSEETQLSKGISSLKTHSNPFVRYPSKFIFAVSKISVNIAKQSIDIALPAEAIYKTIQATNEGIKLNTEEGKVYSNALVKYKEGLVKGVESLTLDQKKYLNNLMAKGAFGVAQYLIIGWLLQDDKIKYGYAYNPTDPFHTKFGRTKGSDGKELKNGEWEIGGVRMPELVNIGINHSPYFLPASLAALNYQQSKRTDNGQKNLVGNIIGGDINEVLGRLPFAGAIDLMMGLTGDEYRIEHTVASFIPSLHNVAKWTDEDANGERVKRDTNADTFLGRIGNIWKSEMPGLEKTLPIKGNIESIINQPKKEIDADIEKADNTKLKRKDDKLKGDEIPKFREEKQAAREQIFNRDDLTDKEKIKQLKKVKSGIRTKIRGER